MASSDVTRRRGAMATDERGGLLVAVCSCRPNFAKRHAVRESWAGERCGVVEVIHFVGDGDIDVADEVVVVDGMPDDYAHLAGKVRGFFRHAVDTYQFDWLFKCDDDTYVALDRLVALTREGFEHAGNADFLRTRGAASGGAGYLLSRRLVEALAADESLPAIGPEDVILSGAAVKLCGRTLETNRLWYDPTSFPRRENAIITSHWLPPDWMRAVHTVYREEPWHVLTVDHPQWHDQVLLYENGVCARRSSSACGQWVTHDDGALVLQWFSGIEDRLALHSPGGMEGGAC